MAHARSEAPGEARGDRATEREPGQAQRRVAREHLDEQAMHEVQVRGAGRFARDGRGVAVRRMVERVHGEAGRERLDVPGPVPRRAHAAVEEDEVWAAPIPPYGHPWLIHHALRSTAIMAQIARSGLVARISR
jgi:hypothetical protein